MLEAGLHSCSPRVKHHMKLRQKPPIIKSFSWHFVNFIPSCKISIKTWSGHPHGCKCNSHWWPLVFLDESSSGDVPLSMPDKLLRNCTAWLVTNLLVSVQHWHFKNMHQLKVFTSLSSTLCQCKKSNADVFVSEWHMVCVCAHCLQWGNTWTHQSQNRNQNPGSAGVKNGNKKASPVHKWETDVGFLFPDTAEFLGWQWWGVDGDNDSEQWQWQEGQ